jgi:hypothetical protein
MGLSLRSEAAIPATNHRWKRHSKNCHPERSRGTCGVPFSLTTFHAAQVYRSTSPINLSRISRAPGSKPLVFQTFDQMWQPTCSPGLLIRDSLARQLRRRLASGSPEQQLSELPPSSLRSHAFCQFRSRRWRFVQAIRQHARQPNKLVVIGARPIAEHAQG